MVNEGYHDEDAHDYMGSAEASSITFMNSMWVNRYHTNPVMKNIGQTNGDHSARVAMILIRYCPCIDYALLHEAVLHDSGEIGSADVAGPIKVANPGIGTVMKPIERRVRLHHGIPELPLTDEQHAWLSFADLAECIHTMRTYAPHLERFEDWKLAVIKTWERGADLGLHEVSIAQIIGEEMKIV